MKDGALTLESDYFSRKEPRARSGWRHFKGGEDARERKYQFGWPLGDVVTALVSSGLRIDHLSEYPRRANWRFGDKQDEVKTLPGTYLLVASRES